MRFFLKVLPVVALSMLVAAAPASAKTSKVKGVVSSVDSAKDSVIVKAGKKKIKVQLASSTRLAGGDRSNNGSLGLEDIKKGDKVSVSGKRKGSTVTASSFANLSTRIAGDKNSDGVPDDLAVIETKATILEVNAQQRVLTVDVSSSEDEALSGTQLNVSLGDGAQIVVGDRNRDRVRDWNDVQVGDKISLLLLDPVNPDFGGEAVLMVDISSFSGKKGKGKVKDPSRTPMGGEVTEVDAEVGLVTFQPPRMDLNPVTVLVDDSTELEVADINQDGALTVDDIQPTDRLHALVDASDPEALLAVKMEVEPAEWNAPDPGDDNPGDGSDDNPGDDNPGDGPSHADMLKGQLVSVSDSQLVMAVKEGAYGGSQVIVEFGSGTQWLGRDTSGDGKVDQRDLAVGGRLAVLTSGDPMTAVRVSIGRPPEQHQED